MWTGDKTDANFISGQFRLLHENITEARQALKGPGPLEGQDADDWAKAPLDSEAFEPIMPDMMSFYLFVTEACLRLEVRTLVSVKNPAPKESSLTGWDMRGKLREVMGVKDVPAHGEAENIYAWRGEEVRVRERIRVESGDPCLMAVMAKLAALEHAVAGGRRSLEIVMGEVAN